MSLFDPERLIKHVEERDDVCERHLWLILLRRLCGTVMPMAGFFGGASSLATNCPSTAI